MRPPRLAQVVLEGVGGEVAQDLVRVAAFDQRQPFGQEPLQFDRADLRSVLLALAALLRLFVVVEFALDPVGRAVEDVDDAPEQVFEVGLEAGVLRRLETRASKVSATAARTR